VLFIVYSTYLIPYVANFPALVTTSAVPILHACCIAHSWLPKGTILVNSCNSGDKCNCQNNECFFAVAELLQ